MRLFFVFLFIGFSLSASDAAEETLKPVSIFSDQKAAEVGDIVTIIIVESASASKSASTSAKKESEKSGGINDLFGIAIKGNALFPRKVDVGSTSIFDGSGSTTRNGTLMAKISAQVTEVLQGGGLRVEGKREIVVNGEKQTMTISGLCRRKDITAENTILSTYLADAQIKYEGEGLISKQQKPGLLHRILDWLWIF